MGGLLKAVRPDMSEGYDVLFYDRLPSAAQRMASNPRDVDAFIEGVTIYHIVVEATLALTGQHFELETLREQAMATRAFIRGSPPSPVTSRATSTSALRCCRRPSARTRSASPP